MKVQIVKHEIPTEISQAGGASVMIVNKDTTELETSVDEAKDALIVMGDKMYVKGTFVGLFKSMVKGIERDGNARTLGDFLTLYPVPTGEFDLDKGWDPAVNGVRIRVRLMNEMEIDIAKWEFEDVTPGRQPFKIESVKAGAVTGVIRLDSPVEMNGNNLPLTDRIRVDWEVADTALSGTVPAAKVTGTVTRTDIAADALASLNTPANDGRKINFTVRGNYANTKVSAVLKYVPPTPIYTSTLGGTKIYSGVTTAGDKLPTDDIHVTSADDVVVFTGDMKQTEAEHPTTGIASAYLTGCGEENLPLTLVFDTANGKMTAKLGLAMFQLDPGSYENAKIVFRCYKDGQQDGLEIAKKVIKSE